MLGRKHAFIAVIVLLLVGFLEAASGQFPIRRTRERTPAVADGPGPEAYRPLPPSREVGPPADYTLRVFFDHRYPEAKAKVYRQLKDQLNKARIGVPADRIAYFQTVISPDARQVGGWSGLIHSFKEVEGGLFVELRVSAVQDGMVDTANVMEQYLLVNGQVKYLGFYVPNDVPRVQVGY